MLRAGNAASSTAAEHIEVTKLALAQMARRLRRRVLIRTDSGGGTHEFLAWLASPGRRLHYRVGMPITDDISRGDPVALCRIGVRASIVPVLPGRACMAAPRCAEGVR